MKKFLVLVLAFTLAFALAAPAMAFTSDEDNDDDTPYGLDIYLVDYDDDDLFGYVSLPASDRGYARNEIVSAVVELDVPEDEDPADDYGYLEFGGDHVSLDVSDNDDGDLMCAGFADGRDTDDEFSYDDDEDVLTRDVDGDFLNTTKDKTYKWLFFAKVTGDDASLYAKMVDGDHDVEFEGMGESNDLTLTLTLSGDDYIIIKSIDSDGDVEYYSIEDEDGNVIYLYVNDNYKTTGMAIDLADDSPDDEEIPLGVNTSGVLGVVEGAKILTSGHKYDDVMDVYEDVCQDVFDLDYYHIGNYLRDSFFENMVSAHTIIATVDIKPWTAYVTIPDVPDIIVDPPKTGDAASIMGFVMVALAGSSAVALKKRG